MTEIVQNLIANVKKTNEIVFTERRIVILEVLKQFPLQQCHLSVINKESLL